MSETDFDPAVVETEAELAEAVRLPHARDADKLFEILQTTESTFITFESAWWGKEAFGAWGDAWLIQPDGTSDGGALFVDEAIDPSDPIGKLSFAERVTDPDYHGGYTSEAARRERRKAFHWDDDRARPGPGTLPTDERDRVTDVSCPLSVITLAVRTPESADNFLIEDGGLRRGKLSEGDLRVDGTTHTRYGTKAVLKGDTYNALSSEGADVSGAAWDDAHPAFNGDEWTCDPDGASLLALGLALNDAGFTLALPESFGESVAEALEGDGDDVLGAFGFN